MRKALALLKCSHPEPVVAVTLIAGFLALTAGRGAGTAWVVLAVLAGQLFVGWSNDYLDRARDADARRDDKPLATHAIDPRIVATAAVLALIVALPLSLASGLRATIVHLIGLGSAATYNLGLKATLFSPVPYAISFGLMPAFITLGLRVSHLPPLWALAAAALIGVGGHFAQARPDVHRDRRQGVIGLPQFVGDRASAILAAAFLAAAAISIAAGTRSPATLLALIPAAAVAVTSPKTGFRLTLLTAAITVFAFILNGHNLSAAA